MESTGDFKSLIPCPVKCPLNRISTWERQTSLKITVQF